MPKPRRAPATKVYPRYWKRSLDAAAAGTLLVATSPLLGAIAVVVRRDGGPALYRAVRVGQDGVAFKMLKFRTMIVDADRIGPPSTADDDNRITGVGRLLRRFKLDELPQLINVVRGDMSLVGPRPEIAREVALYGSEERQLLSVRPGITDYASIVFSNEGEMLRGSEDPHAAYRTLIRPGKIWLGLHYVATASAVSDLTVLALTVLAMFSPGRARRLILRLVPGVITMVPGGAL